MVKRPFFGLGKPVLKYAEIKDLGEKQVKEIPLSDRITLMCKSSGDETNGLTISVGDQVVTGQKLDLREIGGEVLVSSVTGTVTGVSMIQGYARQPFISVSIDTTPRDRWDTALKKTAVDRDPEKLIPYLPCLPGISDPGSLIPGEKAIDTVIINGLDQDLMVVTNQLVLRDQADRLSEGVDLLRRITGARRIVLVTPPYLKAEAEKSGAEVRIIKPVYPRASNRLLIREILQRPVPPWQDLKEIGAAFISAQGVVALGDAGIDGKLPIAKTLTVIDKNNRLIPVNARIGTPVGDILKSLGLELSDGDRLVLGGPMGGRGIYSEEIPILNDTDAIMVQDKSQVIPSGSDPCINCGECVRACPSKIPVNMLVRLLENGLYEEAANEYDLLSCVECGLCSYVCVMRIPIFHYIMLGKHELALTGGQEEQDG